jgi:XTP/dITP diphosphohydrolase
LLGALEAIPAPWKARYRCALVYVDCANAPDDAPLIAESSWEGWIVRAPRGCRGFGYDPHFWLPELGLTVAELDSREKNRLGHRGRALRELKRLLESRRTAAVDR